MQEGPTRRGPTNPQINTDNNTHAINGESSPLLGSPSASGSSSSHTLGAEYSSAESDGLLGSHHDERGRSPGFGEGHVEDDGDEDEANLRLGRTRGSLVVIGFAVLIFLQASNMSGMTMTQSAIAADLHSYNDAMWFTTSFLISVSSFTPLAGRLASIFSPRSLILPVAFFIAVGSVIASQAGSFAVFILGRVVMGVGCAGVMTLSVILVLELTTKKRRGTFVGLANAVFTVGLSVGAVVYAALLPYIGWRALFLCQAPVALISSLVIFTSMPVTRSADPDLKRASNMQKLFAIDYTGALLLILTITTFLYSLSGDIQVAPLVFSMFSFATFLIFEYRVAADPIIPLKVLSSRGILMSCLAQVGFMTARWSILYYAPVFMLSVRGFSPAVAGSILIPTNIGFGTGNILAGYFHIRRNGSFWLPCIISFACFSVALYFLSLVASPAAPYGLFITFIVLNGLATGAGTNYTLAHLLHLSHADTQYVTTSLLGTFRGFGGSFGTAIGGGIFYRILKNSLIEGYRNLEGGGDGLSEERTKLVEKLLGSPAMVFGGGLTDAERGVATEGYAAASRGTWMAAAALGVLVVFLQAGTGRSAPKTKEDEDTDTEVEARAVLLESEGVGEA